ncbi:MAG: cbb3-type cytochrome c oxidase subunit I [Opitutaceae bacterium]|nr:cbb3-type cytochrome c oxidase subunit I [Opitutaceae bacterium]
MPTVPTNAVPAEVTAIDTQARGPLLLLLGSGLLWLVVGGVLALIAAIQLHSPQFLADCAYLTPGRAQALRETAFVYGWLANAGLGLALWILGRLGGEPLRGLNWAVAGTLFWNLGIAAGLVGIATGDMTSFTLLQLPRYVLPLLVFAYACIALPGVLAWSGRRADMMYASQWYAVAALFLFPWLLMASQAVLLWWPVRGVVQPIAAGWHVQSMWTLWLAPLALAVLHYVLPKVSGRTLPAYEWASLSFWTLLFAGAWTGGRHLVGGPVPAWIPTMAVVAGSLLLFHYLVLVINCRGIMGAEGTGAGFLRFGFVAYVLFGGLDFLASFRSLAEGSQFTLVEPALREIGLYGAISMMFFGGIYYAVPRLTNRVWASGAMIGGHRVLVIAGIVGAVLALAIAGNSQGSALLDPKVSFAEMANQMRVSLLAHTAAQAVLLAANLLLLVNFLRSACCCGTSTEAPPALFAVESAKEGSAS